MLKATVYTKTRNDREIQIFSIPTGIINIPHELVSTISIACFVAKELIQYHRGIASQIIGAMKNVDFLVIENEQSSEPVEILGSDILELLN